MPLGKGQGSRRGNADPDCCFSPPGYRFTLRFAGILLWLQFSGTEQRMTQCLMLVGVYLVCSHLLVGSLTGIQLMCTMVRPDTHHMGTTGGCWCRDTSSGPQLQSSGWHGNKKIKTVQNKCHGFPLKWRFHLLPEPPRSTFSAESHTCTHLCAHTLLPPGMYCDLLIPPWRC